MVIKENFYPSYDEYVSVDFSDFEGKIITEIQKDSDKVAFRMFDGSIYVMMHFKIVVKAFTLKMWLVI